MTYVSRPLYGIDSGGSTTSIRAWSGEHWMAPSVNPSSMGKSASSSSIRTVFNRIHQHAQGLSLRPAVWLASASLDPAAPGREVARLAAAARSAGLRGDLVISNDITPLVLDAPAGAGHVVAVCGTGSGFAATDGISPPCRIGGCEYLASDEGSAFDLGLRGLRAAVRALDGRGTGTALTALFAEQTGTGVPALARELAQTSFPKAPVAALAPLVVRAWQEGDGVAADVVGGAIDELVLGVSAARKAAGLQPGWRLSATGGVMTGSPEFFRCFAAAAARLGAGTVRLLVDPATAILAAITQFTADGPLVLTDRRVGDSVWHIDLTVDKEPRELQRISR
ncbi:MAG TPA: BadF/BadG/BcrA/BcrD ATPase family protein [Streptosporangiaceae bacterium]